MCPLNVARDGITCTVCNGRLYALGGLCSNVVEEYDSETNKWKKIAPLTINRCLSKVVTIEKGHILGKIDL